MWGRRPTIKSLTPLDFCFCGPKLLVPVNSITPKDVLFFAPNGAGLVKPIGQGIVHNQLPIFFFGLS